MSTEHNMATLLAKIMFGNYNSSLLRQHTVNQYFFVFYRVTKAPCLVTQPYFYPNLLSVNNGLVVNSVPLPPPPPHFA